MASIPPAWLRHAVPPLHKGGFLFAWTETTGKSKERNGCSVTLAASRRSHIFFAQANTTGKSKDRNGCGATLPGQDCSPAPTGVGLPAPEQEGAQRIPTGDRNASGGTPQKTTIGGYDEQGNGAIAL